MRTLAVTLLATAIAGLALAGTANAATVSLIWTGTTGSGATGGTAIDAAAGDIITLTVFAGDNSTNLGTMQVSLEWDLDLVNELDHNGDTELTTCPPWQVCNSTQIVNDSTGASKGDLNGFGAGMIFGSVNVPVGTAIGTVSFVVNGSVVSDGADVQVWQSSSTFNDAFLNAIPFNIATAAVNAIPEPGTAGLLGLGLLGLGLAGRRRS